MQAQWIMLANEQAFQIMSLKRIDWLVLVEFRFLFLYVHLNRKQIGNLCTVQPNTIFWRRILIE